MIISLNIYDVFIIIIFHSIWDASKHNKETCYMDGGLIGFYPLARKCFI
jgi:hypothetical protein